MAAREPASGAFPSANERTGMSRRGIHGGFSVARKRTRQRRAGAPSASAKVRGSSSARCSWKSRPPRLSHAPPVSAKTSARMQNDSASASSAATDGAKGSAYSIVHSTASVRASGIVSGSGAETTRGGASTGNA